MGVEHAPAICVGGGLLILSSLSALDELELSVIVRSTGWGNSANLLVVEQNKKLPRMLPCGDPPGTGRGVEYSFPTRTDIDLPYKKTGHPVFCFLFHP